MSLKAENAIDSFTQAVRKSPDLQRSFMKCNTLEEVVGLAAQGKYAIEVKEMVEYILSRKDTSWRAFFEQNGVDFELYVRARTTVEQEILDARAARFKKTATNTYCDSATVISCYSCPTGVRIGCPLC
ncbi:Nif11 family protein [Enhygromyxa salina]|nr:Nif11 family protein [Enhygromyxa salina]